MKVAPSIYAHALNGILTMLAVVFSICYYGSLKRLEPFKLVIILLLFAIAFGVHGLSHLGLEGAYHYNPLKYFKIL
jgi:hypothetical protein